MSDKDNKKAAWGCLVGAILFLIVGSIIVEMVKAVQQWWERLCSSVSSQWNAAVSMFFQNLKYIGMAFLCVLVLLFLYYFFTMVIPEWQKWWAMRSAIKRERTRFLSSSGPLLSPTGSSGGLTLEEAHERLKIPKPFSQFSYDDKKFFWRTALESFHPDKAKWLDKPHLKKWAEAETKRINEAWKVIETHERKK